MVTYIRTFTPHTIISASSLESRAAKMIRLRIQFQVPSIERFATSQEVEKGQASDGWIGSVGQAGCEMARTEWRITWIGNKAGEERKG